MATTVVMEALSPTMEEGRLVAWKKKEGERVAVGETLAEVETDKAVMELVARVEGVLRKIVLPEGSTVPVGALVGVIAGPDEDLGEIGRTDAQTHRRTEGAAERAPDAKEAAVRAERAVQPTERPGPATPTPAVPVALGRVLSSPLARRLAAEKGVDLALVAGTGPAGRVVKRDVEAATGALPAVRAPGAAVPPLSSGFEDVPLTTIRKTIARRLVQSLGPVPHFFLTTEIEMERACEAREHLKSFGERYQISFNDLIIKAAALALRQHRAVNAAFLEDRIRYFGDVHVGIAVAVEDGLITPVIRYADKKGLAEIAAESQVLAEKARARKLMPDEYTGATFSVSNLGMFDIDEFTAVINPPEAGVLAVGRIAEKPVATGGGVVPRRMMRVTMSCDHRVIDGATGARFLQTVKLMLENPLAMLL